MTHRTRGNKNFLFSAITLNEPEITGYRLVTDKDTYLSEFELVSSINLHCSAQKMKLKNNSSVTLENNLSLNKYFSYFLSIM